MAQYAHVQASTEWHSSLSNQHRSNILNHSKRKAEDELESQAHIASQFKKLRLNQNHANIHTNNHVNTVPSQSYNPQNHYHHVAAVPRAPSPANTLPQAQPTSPEISFRPHIDNTDARPALSAAPLGIAHHDFALSPSQSAISSIPPITSPSLETDYMPIDDTPHRIIIHDLSTEIAEIEAEEASRSHDLFLPDIDKKVSGDIAAHLLQNGHHSQSNSRSPHDMTDMRFSRAGLHSSTQRENPNTALILYRDPSSISVPEEEDVVRKTIIEARKRAREKAVEEQREREREEEERALRQHWDEGGMVNHFDHRMEADETEMDDDLDPMDIE